MYPRLVYIQPLYYNVSVFVVSMTMYPDKQLYELFQKIEGCGYFDRPASDTGDDEVSVFCHPYLIM